MFPIIWMFSSALQHCSSILEEQRGLKLVEFVTLQKVLYVSFYQVFEHLHDEQKMSFLMNVYLISVFILVEILLGRNIYYMVEQLNIFFILQNLSSF